MEGNEYMAHDRVFRNIDWSEVTTTLECRKCKGTVVVYDECQDSKCEHCGQWYKTDCCPHDELPGCPTEYWLTDEITNKKEETR